MNDGTHFEPAPTPTFETPQEIAAEERRQYLAGRRIMKSFLVKLSDRDAESVWLYLDATPHAVTNMIDYVADNHPKLAKRVCGPSRVRRKLRFDRIDLP